MARITVFISAAPMYYRIALKFNVIKLRLMMSSLRDFLEPTIILNL